MNWRRQRNCAVGVIGVYIDRKGAGLVGRVGWWGFLGFGLVHILEYFTLMYKKHVIMGGFV